MIARDEQALLPGALESVSFADQIIVGVDSRSKDKTAEIARKVASVHTFEWEDDFSAARNIGLKKATKDWILVIDADDRITEWGRLIIKEVLRHPRTDVDVYGLLIENQRLDGSLMRVDPLPSVRLWPNYKGIHCIYYQNRVHEVPVRSRGELQIGWLRGGNGIVHYGYDPTIYELRHKDERNLGLLLKQLEEKPEDRLLWFELARQHMIGGRQPLAVSAAETALELPGYLRPELVAELEGMAQLCSR